MKHLLLIIIGFGIISLISCNNDKALTLEHFVEIDKIQKVEMRNNSGEFYLSNKQIEQFKEQISTMIYEPNITVKGAAIYITLTIDNKEYSITTSTNGSLAEVDNNLITKNKSEFNNPFFKLNGINFDNYKKEL